MVLYGCLLGADEVEVKKKAPAGEDLSQNIPAPSEIEEEKPIWIDRSQEWINEVLYRRVVWLDSIFYEDLLSPREDPRSRFRLKIFTVMDLENLEEPSLDGKASASVRLPGLENRFRLILDSDALNAFPGTSPDEERGDNRLLLRRMGSWVDADVGAKIRTPPVAFARLSMRQNWSAGTVKWHVHQRFYYETGEGFGTLTSLAQHCWLSPGWMLGHVSSARWSEETTGVEWQDRVLLMNVLKVLEEEKHGEFIGNGDISHGAGLRLGADGRDDGSHEMTRYHVSLVYRQPLFKRDYLYLELSPEVQWKRENDWTPDYSLRLGLDILFWRDR